MSRQTSIQLTDATQKQIQQLKTAGFGSFTDIARVAIDRMAREESRPRRPYSVDDLVDMFAPEADWNGLATLDLDVITAQIAELRQDEPDAVNLTDRQIAESIQARALLLADQDY